MHRERLTMLADRLDVLPSELWNPWQAWDHAGKLIGCSIARLPEIWPDEFMVDIIPWIVDKDGVSVFERLHDWFDIDDNQVQSIFETLRCSGRSAKDCANTIRKLLESEINC